MIRSRSAVAAAVALLASVECFAQEDTSGDASRLDSHSGTAPAPIEAAATHHEIGTSALGHYPGRVYVPNAVDNTVQIIDPETFEITATHAVGEQPHHVTPSWDLTKLFVNNTLGNSLSVIDPMTGTVTGEIPVTDPYNLYFTTDGSMAIVVAEKFRRLDFYDYATWEFIRSVPVPWPGVDHMAFSRDGSYLVVSCEWSGRIAKVDLNAFKVVADMAIGAKPIDVVRPPGQSLMFVADQGMHGVFVIDPDAWTQLEFIPTGEGAHGILLSHDRKRLYVSNRLDGSISVLDIASRKIVTTWKIGGSPDMGQLSPDGTQLWISSRYHASVRVIDTTTGKLIKWIRTGHGPHGLTYFPTSAMAHSLGHNGVYLED